MDEDSRLFLKGTFLRYGTLAAIGVLSYFGMRACDGMYESKEGRKCEEVLQRLNVEGDAVPNQFRSNSCYCPALVALDKANRFNDFDDAYAAVKTRCE